MKRIASCSFGKDSLATVILALEHGEPLDEVVYCEVMFDKKISGEVPEHIDFIREKAIPWIENRGIGVTMLRSKKTYIQNFNHVIMKSKNGMNGKIRAFPMCGRCTINRDCKMPPINAWKKSLPHSIVQYPDLWARMLELQALPNKATEFFNRTMKFSDYDYNFKMDDLQIAFY